MTDSGDLLLIDTSEAVITLTMNRPDVLNAMNGGLADALKAALE